MSLPRSPSLLTIACGTSALLWGLLAVIGWLTHTPGLLRLNENVVAMVFSTAVCVALSGLTLVLSVAVPRWRRPLSGAVGLILASLSVGMLCQFLLGVRLGLNFTAFHAWLPDANPAPGQMAPNTALSFLLLGLGLLTEAAGFQHARVQALRGMLAVIVATLGLTGLLAYFMRPELLFGWYSHIARMAPYTAVSVVVLGVGFWGRWQAELQSDGPDGHRRRIFRTAAVVLSVVAVTTGAAGFAFQLNSVTQKAEENLSRSLADRRLVLEQALSNAMQSVDLMAANPQVIAAMESALLKPDRAASRDSLTAVANSMLDHGFSQVSFQGPTQMLTSVGRSMGVPLLEVHLPGAHEVALAWRDGHVLRQRQAVRGRNDKLLGYLITEQRVSVLSHMLVEVSAWGESHDMALCTASANGVDIHCFPQRHKAQPFMVPSLMKGHPLPVTLALRGQTGVTNRLDYRQHMVLAAYAPVGKTGLGMVLKVDTNELYAPARQQFLIAVPAVVLIVLAGLWALRMRLRPMVQELVITRQAAQANEARFVAAMESSLDAFYILRGERDQQGELYDFRFTYVTARGAALVSLEPEQVEGQLLCELLPLNREAGFFEKYKCVLESGIPLAEEFSVDQPGVAAAWISHQIVKLGDDCIAITSRDISARKRVEEAMRESEERLRVVTENVPALIAYMALDERYLFINQGGAELYGQPLENIVGKTVLEVVGPDNYALMKPHIEVVAAGYPVTYERQVNRIDGIRHVQTSYFPQYDDRGVVTHVCALAHDITERKQMEKALAVSQDRLKAVTDNMPALISYIDREHRFRFANQAYREWLSVEPSALLGCSLRELYGEQAYARIRPRLEQALAGETVTYERDLACPDGVRRVHATMTPHRNSAGEVVGLYVLMNDITALTRAEQQSALNHERLTLALEGSHLALFDWNLTTNQVYHSAHWSSMLGGPQVETTTTLESLSHLVHPEDLASVQAKVADSIKGRIPFYCAEHRVRTGSGEWIWILSRGRVVERDADGRACRLSGTNADITEQKRIEAQLHRMAKIDSLTELPNRALFHDRLNGALNRVRRHGKAMALLILDIDFFKEINDSLGHDAGDAVLQEFGRRLSCSVRQTDTVARLGGDEFTIILEELHAPAEADMIARKVVTAMTKAFDHDGRTLKVSASIGVAYLDHADEDAAHLIKRADQALYQAKAAGRNTYRCADEPLAPRAA
ncbi:MAG: sensor domain-containing diguanylate cyclase [Rubrivivax sp.]|nr:MAG: sensor domain-containing diguanylate cyclase [Rubrivivax sp.]